MRTCDICTYINNNDNWVINLRDDKNSGLEINGHQSCIDELYLKIKNIKDLDKKPINKVLEILGLTRLESGGINNEKDANI